MVDGFKFGNRATWDFSMRVEKYPRQSGAARKFKEISVPGRNGALHIDEGCFENFQQPYECYFHGVLPTPEQSHAIRAWLQGTPGYQRLEDVYDPEHFRMASFTGPLDVENHFNRYGRCVVTFDCMPQAFLKSGEIPISFVVPGLLYNSTGFPALPMITVYGSAAGTLTVGTCAVEIKSLEDVIILDSDTQNAFRRSDAGALENKNACIYAPTFPQLLPGANVIAWDGGIERVEIIPRWWTL
ncbi:MAG: hypothetical protein IJO56_05925 [Oscillospiraceae bacterium]|nr:hypothetical protein [Oscillospiraceae bacterium]